MSSTTHHPGAPPAPWKGAFLEHVAKNNEFVLSTLHPAPAGSPVPYLPRARFCVFRGMWTELPENRHNEAPRNPPSFASEMPTFTSDVRMEKIPDLFATGPGRGGEDQARGSGGGGPVEAIFWIKEVQTQWRVKGTAWVVGPDMERGTAGEESSGVRTVKAELGRRMRPVGEGGGTGWSWARELTAHFGNCSPAMRGSWRNPPPGTRADGEPDEAHRLGQKVDDLDDEVARANFRVVVVRPDEVERLDLSDPEKARRWRYTLVEEDGEDGTTPSWQEEALWP